jgi:formate dehydrogenase subunit gamma
MMQASAYSLAEAVEAVVQEHAGAIGALLPVLHSLQQRLGYIPSAAIPLLAKALNLSRAEVHGVMHFYHDFRSEPAGDHVIQLCRAEACQAMGGRALEAHVKARLGVDYGATTADGRFTLEPVYCLGNCACTPSLRIDDAIHARVTPGRFDQLLDELQESGA